MKLILRMLSCVAILTATVQAQEDSRRTLGTEMTNVAKKFLGPISKSDQSKFVLKFDDPTRRAWHKTRPQRTGLEFRDMSQEQHELCDELLKLSLSRAGYHNVVRILALNSPLKRDPKLPQTTPVLDPERYCFNIYGTPDSTGTWGWSLDGHHLSLNFVIQDNLVTSDTPTFWGADHSVTNVLKPNEVEAGERKLTDAERLAYIFVTELDSPLRIKANIANTSPEDVRTDAKPLPPQSVPQGIPSTLLTVPQKTRLMTILDMYNSAMAAPIAAARMNEIKAAGLDQIFFAWAGVSEPGGPRYYRIQGPTFVLEIVDVQADTERNTALHMHAMWRSLKHDFGLPANAPKPVD